jgi:carbamate kinase
MTSTYVKEDPTRSYCGIIHIFNYLADSLKYNRVNDVGYMIGRLFVNREQHYFIEGKKEIGLLYDTFSTAQLNQRVIRTIIESAVHYTINFDLLTPSYENMKEVTVEEIQTLLDNIRIRTGKRLGFRFQADKP